MHGCSSPKVGATVWLRNVSQTPLNHPEVFMISPQWHGITDLSARVETLLPPQVSGRAGGFLHVLPSPRRTGVMMRLLPVELAGPLGPAFFGATGHNPKVLRKRLKPAHILLPPCTNTPKYATVYAPPC